MQKLALLHLYRNLLAKKAYHILLRSNANFIISIYGIINVSSRNLAKTGLISHKRQQTLRLAILTLQPITGQTVTIAIQCIWLLAVK